MIPLTDGKTNRLGQVQTVLGLIPVAAVGVTLPHEHLFVDVSCMFDPPTQASERRRAYAPFALENLGWIRTYYFRHYPNLFLDDEREMAAEASAYRQAGGDTIVEVTPLGIGRDPLALARLARTTGLNIVMATGYYVEVTHPPEVAALSEAELTQKMIGEIETGISLTRADAGGQDWQPEHVGTGVRAGTIKAACGYPMTPNERKLLRAAVAAQRATGAGLTIHVGRSDASALEILGVLREAGANLAHTSLDHLELRVEKLETLLEIADSGCFMELDMFGHESSYYPLTKRDMPGDGQRLDVLTELKARGLVDRLLISHDICTKHRLLAYGGHGYGHILNNIVPRMRERGFSAEDIHTILVANPAKLLVFVAPKAS